jgi:serine/threonine protein kinase
MDTIGRYRLERRLGAGSFATVWLGHDDDLDVPVAVKVLAENWSDNADVRNRFLGEARILRRIRDPRIVSVYDIGAMPDGRPYFVMDFVNGGSLEDLRRTGIAPAEALRLCAEACRAIDVLHAHHVLHRDVTPGNLLIQRSPGSPPQVVLADLGVAKAMAETSEMTMTAGTPAFMSPEQAAGGALDGRVDVYSLAAVSYAMLARRPPFVVRNVTDIISRDPTLNPPPLAAEIGAPASLDTVLAAGLAYRVDRRPPTAAILADALDVVATEMERSRGVAAPAAETRTVLTPAEPWRGESGSAPVREPDEPPPGGPYSSASGAYWSASGAPGTMSPVDPASSGFPASSLPSPTSSVPPHPSYAATGGWPAPDSRGAGDALAGRTPVGGPVAAGPPVGVPVAAGPPVGGPVAGGPRSGGTMSGGTRSRQTPRRSGVAFVALVVLACAALFALSLLITVLLLR